VRAGAVGAALALAVAAAVRRRRALAAVAPELRHRGLWVPVPIADRVTLALVRRRTAGASRPVAGVAVTTHEVPGGGRLHVHVPPSRRRPSAALLWIHGGGLILGSPEGSHERCSRMARDLGIVVAAPSYRLAPEHPFPAALDDLTAALRWLHAQADELGVDRTRLAIGGTSAGGGLAGALAQRLHDEGGIDLRLQALLAPMLDDRTVRRQDHGGCGRLTWTPRSNRFAWRSYLGHRIGDHEPPAYAVPARREDLRGLPPAWIGIGELDLFHDEAVAYARRLEAAGVPVELRVEPGMYHGAEGDVDPPPPAMRAFTRSMIEALRRALA
jgi:acetyl esterase/lipase